MMGCGVWGRWRVQRRRDVLAMRHHRLSSRVIELSVRDFSTMKPSTSSGRDRSSVIEQALVQEGEDDSEV